MNEFHLKRINRRKSRDGQFYKRATARSRLKIGEMIKQELKRRYHKLLFKGINFTCD